MTFTILTVCTGNVCRSPFAEVDLERYLKDLDVRVTSAGTGALVGEPVPEPGQRLAREMGIDLSEHRGRQMLESDVQEAGLILALTREHRKAVVSTSPAALRRTFTLREFARIADHFAAEAGTTPAGDENSSDEDRLTSLVAFSARVRGTIPPPAENEDLDITDPFRQPDSVYRESYDAISRAVESIARFLTAGSTPPARN
ncbi:protein-tyrosine-phosphatase [Microbacterium sp. B19]|uniref:arsenate reductase/protein-tyrosine-phosphatase family protein n=1 Tax=Microbacterium sp. B19 TaxID=96765 RepID=UPI0003494F45|nr:protein-tyrosine-phosphatase [Microbacterium sp. B19]